MEIAAETGIISLIFYILLIIVALIDFRRHENFFKE